MPFVKRNAKYEENLLDDLLKDPECKKIADDFDAEMKFRRELYKARKEQAISQKELSALTGLSQQMISRIETGWTDTKVGTLLKYLNGIGYSLKVVKNDN